MQGVISVSGYHQNFFSNPNNPYAKPYNWYGYAPNRVFFGQEEGEDTFQYTGSDEEAEATDNPQEQASWFSLKGFFKTALLMGSLYGAYKLLSKYQWFYNVKSAVTNFFNTFRK